MAAALRAAVRGALWRRGTLLGPGWPVLAGCGAAAAAAAGASAGCDGRPKPRPPASTAALIEELCALPPAPAPAPCPGALQGDSAVVVWV